jgi:Flp pilus assembly protein TadD
MAPVTTGWRERALEHFSNGEFRAAHAAALERLAQDGDDPEALRLAGRAGVELGADDAVDQLRRVSELAPDDPVAWRDLGDALAADGRLPEAEQAWTRAFELRPDDSVVLTALGHAALAAGRHEDAAARLQSAAEADARNHTASLSLIDIYRAENRLDEALAVARDIWAAAPDDILAGLDVAELSVDTGRMDEAEVAYERLLALDDDEHEVYLRYGQLEMALRGSDWIRGSERAAAVARLDGSPRTQKLLTFFAEQTFGTLDRDATSPEINAAFAASQSGVFWLPPLTEPPNIPELAEVEQALAEARAEHRRIHMEAAG